MKTHAAKPFEWHLGRVSEAKDGCWHYPRVPTTNGYVQMSFGGRQVLAHRAFYEHLRGPVPEGLVLDHLCCNRACVNPQHLEPVTRKENVRRAWALKPAKPPKPPRPKYVRPLLAVCRRGHEYSEANTVYRGRRKKFRICRLCEKIRYERYKRRRLYGLPTPRRKLTIEQRTQLRAGYPERGSYEAWAKRFGVSPCTVRRELLRDD